MNVEEKNEVDAILTVGLRLLDAYMTWFNWLCGLNIVTLVAFAVQTIQSSDVSVVIAIVMLLADALGVGASFALGRAMKNYRQMLDGVSQGKGGLLGGALVSYATAATRAALVAMTLSWAAYVYLGPFGRSLSWHL